MKIIITEEQLRNLLNEGASDIGYHFSKSNKYLINILHNNRIYLTPTFKGEIDYRINKDNFYFLSTTRSKSTGFIGGEVRFKLDLKKIKHNYKIIPVDYYGTTKLYDEQEDRIILNKSYIPNFNKYIISIDVILNKDLINDIIYYTDKYNIPLNVFENKKDLLLSKNPIDYSEYRGDYDENLYNYDVPKSLFFDLAAIVSYKNQYNYNYIINNLIENKNDLIEFNEIYSNVYENLYKYMHGYKISATINHAKLYRDEKIGQLFDLLTKEMHKYDVKSVYEYVEYKIYGEKNTLNEQRRKREIWYHGSADGREISKSRSFQIKTEKKQYINNLDEYEKFIKMLEKLRIENPNLYFKASQDIKNYMDNYEYQRPIFLTDKKTVAKTYANPMRAMDSQNAEERVYQVTVNCNNVVKIYAQGMSFRQISIDSVVDGFSDAGVPKDKILELNAMFNYHNQEYLDTNKIGIIGHWLGFKCIDVIGVLDSYHGGNKESTVRIVLDPSIINI